MIFRSTILFLLALSFLSCKDDFSLEGDFQDVPTAYAFLNAENDRHFVRVQRAFLEAGGNATINAGIIDSIYYGEGDATVIIRNNTRNDSVELERVEAEQFNLERDEGVFASSPNILYTFTDGDLSMRGGDNITLLIRRPNEEDAVAVTNILSPLTFIQPREPIVGLDNYNRATSVSWNKGPNARAFSIDVVFNIRELDRTDPNATREISLLWSVAKSFIPPQDREARTNETFTIDNEDFYRFLGQALEPDANLRRRFLSLDIVVTAAGEEVSDRSRLANANLGITSSQVTPTYTNLEGGIGLVTSTSRAIYPDITLTPSSADSLRDGIHTRDLGF